MLATSNDLLDTVGRLTRIDSGRTLFTTPDTIGRNVSVDYLTSRKQRSGA